MTDAELEEWATAHPHHSQAVAVVGLLARYAWLETIVRTRLADAVEERGAAAHWKAEAERLQALVAAMAERIGAQSALLGRKAEIAPATSGCS